MSKVKYPIGGYAPGPYQNHCVTCKDTFIGDKLAMQCLDCAIGMTLEAKDEEIKRLREALIKAFPIVRRSRNVLFSMPAGQLRAEAVQSEIDIEEILGKEKYNEIATEALKQ